MESIADPQGNYMTSWMQRQHGAHRVSTATAAPSSTWAARESQPDLHDTRHDCHCADLGDGLLRRLGSATFSLSFDLRLRARPRLPARAELTWRLRDVRGAWRPRARKPAGGPGTQRPHQRLPGCLHDRAHGRRRRRSSPLNL